MKEQELGFWEKVVDARQELLSQYANHPEVTLIDIGYSPEREADEGQVGLRLHVTEAWFAGQEQDALQLDVDGIPVWVIYEDD